MRQRPSKDKTPPDAATAPARAVGLLARREHSARELQRKLEARGYEEADAAKAVEKLGRAGLQSNERYAEQLTRTRIAQGYGPVRIRAELEMSGLSGEQIDAALEASGCDWKQLAADAHARKFGRAPRNGVERMKQNRFLYSRGFDADLIRAVLKGAAEED